MKSETKQVVCETLWWMLSIGGFGLVYYGLVFLFLIPGAGALMLPAGLISLLAAHKADQYVHGITQMEYKDPLLLEAEKEVDEYMEEIMS